MASDLTVKRHDTWPPIRGLASDEFGPLSLGDADFVKVLMKSGGTLITGLVTVHDPPLTDPGGDDYNWEYAWAHGDTATAGDYKVELEVTWDDASTPKKVETVPNISTRTLTIEADQDDAPV